MTKAPKTKEAKADMGTEGHQGEPPVPGMFLGDMPPYAPYDLKEGQKLAEVADYGTSTPPAEGEPEPEPKSKATAKSKDDDDEEVYDDSDDDDDLPGN